MQFNKETIEKAFQIFRRLLEAGEIRSEERELWAAYQDAGVREILEDVIEKQMGIKVLAGHEVLYITPDVDNDLFGYTHAELRQAMGLRSNRELYLAYFAMLCLFALLYNSDDQTTRSRDYVPVEELERYVTTQVQRLAAAYPEDVVTLEDDYEINLAGVADAWLELPAFDDTLKNLNLGRNNHVSFLLRVMRFLEREGLVFILEQREIRPSEKLDRIITRYYFNSRRKERILDLLRRPLPLLSDDREVAAGAED